MKSMQRVAGRIGKRSADQQDVGSIIAEFKSTDDALERLLKDLKTWRDGWDDILKFQYDASEAFTTVYKPVEPATYPEQRHPSAQTPQDQMQKCLALQKMYSDQKQDLQQEIGLITSKIMRPVEEAKTATKSLNKTLKHRENTKLDYERYLGRAEHVRAKGNRSAKEESALEKHEMDLQQATIDYQTADDQVKQTFPPIIEAVQTLMPYLLASQIQIQTTLVGQLYTSLDSYCRQQGLPSPAPGDGEIISVHDQQFTGFRKEVESGLKMLASGKAVNLSMHIAEKDGSTYTGLGIRNKSMGLVSRGKDSMPGRKKPPPPPGSINGGTSLQVGRPTPDEEEAPPPKPPRPGSIPSASPKFGQSPIPSPGPGVPFGSKPGTPSYSGNSTVAPYDHKSTMRMPSIPSYPDQPPPAYAESQGSTPKSSYATPLGGRSPRPGTQGSNDYFEGAPLGRQMSAQSLASSAASIAASKKKAPPPVPTKRIPSSQGTTVTALFDFQGQTPEDLPFREGDRIKVLRKTDSTDDWWEGELNGRKGSFPANYVQL